MSENLISEVEKMDTDLQSIERLVEIQNEQIKQLADRLADRLAEQNRIIDNLKSREEDVNRFLGDIGSITVGNAIRDSIDRLDFKL